MEHTHGIFMWFTFQFKTYVGPTTFACTVSNDYQAGFTGGRRLKENLFSVRYRKPSINTTSIITAELFLTTARLAWG